jgi:hypothetical protein
MMVLRAYVVLDYDSEVGLHADVVASDHLHWRTPL